MKSTASAPGKIILFGEHAVVFGEPAIAAAISLRTTVSAEQSDSSTFNGLPLNPVVNPYPFHAIRLAGAGSHALRVESDVPPGAGLGSSAALTVATMGALRSDMEQREVAERSFNVELLAQGRASPIDTSTSAHGHAIFVDRREGENLLWSISSREVVWKVHHIEVPRLSVVIGFTGKGAATGPLVARVSRLHSKYEVARNAVSEIGSIAVEARARLKEGNAVLLGELMNRNQRLLSVIGVSSPELQKLIDAVLPYSYGAKLTGAGGGGSMIALTDRPDRVSEAIVRRGFIPFRCVIGGEGLRIENAEG